MSKKMLVGAILFLVAILVNVGTVLMDISMPFFFNLILIIFGFAGVLIILIGMAKSKKIYKTYSYHGELNILLQAVEKSITQMGLSVNNKSVTDNSFYFSLSEKMKLLTTNWPVHFDIKAEDSEKMIHLNIHSWIRLYSITQAKHTQKKIQEFSNLVKNYVPIK